MRYNMDYQYYIPEALEMVSAWEIEEEQFAQAVNDQAKIMAMTDIELSGFDDFANPYTSLQF
jgi:hypothetical protein